jgi:Holliday junction resolvase
MVVTGGFGNSGTPDFLICCSGIFVGIECKANGNKPTALQRDHIEKINECGGVAFVVNETNVNNLKSILTELMKCQKRNEK